MLYNEFLKTIKECPFCISDNKRILENDHAFLTYSIAPYHPDHLLVIPKRHIEHILDLNKNEVDSIIELQRKSLEILNKLGHTNMCVLVKEGDKLEKSVAHTHYHIIPEVVLESSDHLGVERRVLSDNEINILVSRIEAVK